ncbi:MAG: hypothetical protein ACMUHX_08715 [bacterium]
MGKKNSILFLLILSLLLFKNGSAFGYYNSSRHFGISNHNTFNTFNSSLNSGISSHRSFYKSTSTFNSLSNNNSFYNHRSNNIIDGITNPASPYYRLWHPPPAQHIYNHAPPSAIHLLHHNNMFPKLLNNNSFFVYRSPTKLFSTSSGQYFDFSVEGLREYLDEKLINDNLASYKELDPYIKELEDKKKNAQFTNVILTIAGISMAILGFNKKETNEFGMERNEPNKGLVFSGAGLILAGFFTYNSVKPKRKDLMAFIDEHNIKNPNNLLKVGLNKNKLAKNISTDSGRRQIKTTGRRIISQKAYLK